MSALITQVPQGQNRPVLPAAGVVRPPSPQRHANHIVQEAVKGVLQPQSPRSKGKKTLVLDLDETLVHSSFKPPSEPSIILPVEIDGKKFKVYVLVRPGAKEFLVEMQQFYEVIIYTASLSKYADPLMDILDD